MTGSAHGDYLATRYFGVLDGLRCFSIVPVVWHHSTPRPLPGLLGKGPAGVDLFFCISGFLITTLLLREKSRTGQIALSGFYVRRALRILPLYYAVLLSYVAFAALLPVSAAPHAHFFRTLPYYATFTANWFAGFSVSYPILFSFAWSLCVEEQFYAFWPWLVRALSSRGALFCMLAVLACDAAAERGFLSALLPAGSLALRIVTSFATPIGLGAILALALDSRRGFAALSHALGQTWSAPLALALAIALLVWPSAPLFGFQLGLSALVGACVIRERHALARVLKGRAVSYIGRVSYGVYLLNLTAIGLVRRALPSHASSSLLVFTLSFPLALGLAALSHCYLEAPFLRQRARPRA
ncbi:MAG TPA: acyltransferase [Polyangiaceae bacterium]|nr:acyltransferase [Polyangiaceae bacterium]